MHLPRIPKAPVFWGLWALLVTLLVASSAVADNPYDARQRDLARRVARAGRAPRGAIPLLRMWRAFGQSRPEVTTSELERLSTHRSLTPAQRAYVGALLARVQLRTGDEQGARDATRALGYVTDFRVIGPFDNEGKQGFAEEMPPEARRMEPWAPEASYEGRERPVSWRPYPSHVAHFGYVDFDAIFRPYANVCGYAETFVTSERAQPVSLWLGNGGAAKVWWNGQLVLEDERYRQPDPDRHVALVAAREGANRLLVKLCVAESTWGFFLRIGDSAGAPLTSFSADGSQFRELGADSTRSVRLPRPPSSVLSRLEAAAEGERAPAAALEDLARFMAYTGADDPAERRARDMAARAADRQPTVERLELAATLADERGEVMRFAERAFRIAPRDRQAILLRATVLSRGPSPEEALPLLRGLSGRDDTYAMRADQLRAHILRDLDLVDHAASIVDGLERLAPGAPAWIEERARFFEDAGQADRAMALRGAVVEARYDDTSSRRTLLIDAIRRGDTDVALEHLGALERLMPGNAQSAVFAAAMHEALGRTEEAHAVFVRARQTAPEDATLVAAHGRLLLRLQRQDEASQALRLALDLRPQDAETRELLEQLGPEEVRIDEGYAASSADLLARRGESSGYPTTTLQELTVNTVFENGLGSSFRQFAAQVHDDEGARMLRTYSIQYDPNSQRVDVREARVYRSDGRVLEATQLFEQPLGEPWYRIYYDTRSLSVVFPDLQPGDVVEIQYRIDDISQRNLFADYYGDLHFLQAFSPIRRLDYVLIAPTSRELYFNEPRIDGLTHERTNDGDRRIDHFTVTDAPAIIAEQRMPGMTEIAPFLHVSTYRTWEDVGRWWWGLIKDQLQVDDNLRGIVRDLVRDAPDVQTKVRRIHNWVIRNTRYVALEFGIHGYKPYRVPLIVQRGFGDCKDKASLMYAMFREAGVDARIVLVRTRRNGSIGDLPASLAVFDHAIAYVPELDLYLDGTAEHSGTTELPTMDQGVTVLVVGPDGAELTRTPVLEPSRNRRIRSLTASLQEDGSASVTVEEQVIGAEAPGYRSTYAPEGTRAERFERSLRSLFPGLVLESQTMEHLDDLESDVRLRYRARVPQLGTEDDGAVRVAPSVLRDLVRRLARNPSRRHPLDLGGTSAYEEIRTLTSPSGFRVAQLPEGGEAESDFGRLSLTVESDGREVQTRTEFELRRDRIAPGEYPAFRRWVEQADELLRQRVTMERGQ